MINEGEEAACGLKQKGKAAYEDAEMDPEIEHLIRTLFWEIDNCPQNLTGQIPVKKILTNEIQVDFLSNWDSIPFLMLSLLTMSQFTCLVE
ncbi:unnamed protein product [Sphenostylis stenocarpa]|uniref:Uncharacterized protein n=1 Tax=Sphenostylis stenocarpa TaxID=92480 RepID=A0AA86S8S5_9FABA|nr:unnamed protein product [Sphenostylis stenocarpa]